MLLVVVEAVLVPGAGAIETRTADVWLRPDGIMCVAIRPGVYLDIEASMEINRAMLGLAGETPRRPVLTDISAPHGTDPAVRRYGASENTRALTLKLALVVRTPVSRMLGNAFLKAKRPPFPTRLFTQEEPAIDWLREGWPIDG